MKTTILFTLFLILAIGGTANAQESNDTTIIAGVESLQKYVVLTKKIPQLKPILLTAKHFREEDGASFGDFQIIICGQDIVNITDAATMNPYIDQARELGVTLVACGFSMQKFGVDPTLVPDGIETVDNGIQHNFTLQKKGYYSISL
ncbi:hypothetical protein LEM8419_03451 [Neolewinella maritima]|uniref:Sulfur reduction protein DsrE n=1 Tax=Neolewinella maritima TaxID=1383882 RepID=A0ABN8FDT0_9BACT|nr:hypothetical protein [Neolewinella maritima]CAH1002577.1 hypothetical protein LEM8419_03451 [Neolewinella maritima]